MHDYQMPLVLFTVMSQWGIGAILALGHVKPQSIAYHYWPYLVN